MNIPKKPALVGAFYALVALAGILVIPLPVISITSALSKGYGLIGVAGAVVVSLSAILLIIEVAIILSTAPSALRVAREHDPDAADRIAERMSTMSRIADISCFLMSAGYFALAIEAIIQNDLLDAVRYVLFALLLAISARRWINKQGKKASEAISAEALELREKLVRSQELARPAS